MDDLKKILLSSSVENKQAKRVSYSKETLLILSKNSPCQNQPDCLHDSFFNDDGYWDPELWHQSFPASKEINEDLQKPLSSSFSGSALVLGPQRRSFQGGCHVSVKPTAADPTNKSNFELGANKLPLKLTKSQDVTPNQKPRLRSFQSENYGWSREKVSDKRDHGFHRSRKPDYKKQQSFGGRSFEQRGQAFEEHEPEWFSCGPESKFDTIELQGFEDGGDFGWMGKEIPMDDVPTRKKKPSAEERTKPSKKTAGYDDALKNTNEAAPNIESSKNVKMTTNVEETSNNGVRETKEALSSLEDNQESGVNDASNDDSSQVSRSRFSRWFKSEQINLTDEGASKRTGEPTENIGDSNALESLKQESVDMVPATNTAPNLPQTTPLSVSSLGSQPSSILHSIVPQTSVPQQIPQTSVPQSSSSASDPHQADAFNRLIASIRATDKVKVQMQQRNQQIQALQSIMSSTSNAKNDSSCVTVSSLEGLTLDKQSGQQIHLKQQFERQKDAYHQKIRQIEQQKSASPTFYGNNESYNPMNRDGRNQSTNSEAFHNSQQTDIAEESALATASLAAKLSGKVKKNLQMSNSNPTMDEMRRDASGRPSPNFDPKQQARSSSQQQQDNALLIAQMLAKAGVTEDQLKQLTLKQQELIISMVQNQFSHKDIVKIMGGSPAAPAKSAGDNIPDPRNPLKKPLLAHNPPESTPEAPNFLGRFHVPPQQHIIHPAMMVPHIVRPGISPHMLAPTVNPHMPQLLHQTPTNPAVMLQLQHQQQQQQMYASQVAQQQALIAAALQNQQHPAHNATAQQQIQHKLRMGSRESPDDHFKNPLSQWFSREVLRQSQFHNSQQFLQQQAYFAPNPDARPDAKH